MFPALSACNDVQAENLEGCESFARDKRPGKCVCMCRGHVICQIFYTPLMLRVFRVLHMHLTILPILLWLR